MRQIFGKKTISAWLTLVLANAAACGPADEFTSCEEQSNCSDDATGGEPGAFPWSGDADGAAGEAAASGSGSGGRSGSGSASSGGEDAGSGLGDGGAAAAGAGGAAPHVDDWPPRVVSVTPEDAAAGVEATTTITFVFDEPMDRAATEAAVQPINLGGYTTQWNKTSTELTLTPESLEYASGGDPELVLANVYGARISTAARDRSGNPLQSAAETTFSTLRRITSVSTHQTQSVHSDGQLLSCGYKGVKAQTVGDDESNIYRRSFLRLDPSVWPVDATRLESVILRTEQVNTFGQPFGSSGLGVFVVDGLAAGLEPGVVALDAPPSMRVGVLSDLEQTGPREIDISAFAEGANTAGSDGARLLRLGFEKASNGNGSKDAIQIRCELELETTYLVP